MAGKSMNRPNSPQAVRRPKHAKAKDLGAAHRKLAEADRYRKSGDLRRAQAIAEQLVDRHPDYVGALHTLGLVHIERRGYWQALSCFVRAAMLNPNDWTILINLANVYLGLGAEEMAAHTLEQTMALKTDDPNIPFTLGKIYENQREYELAVECFEKTLQLDPTFVGAAQMLGGCLTHLGRVEDAAGALTKAHKLERKSIQPLASLSQLPASVVSVKVLPALEKVTKRGSGDDDEFAARVAFTRAWALDKQGEHTAAWDLLVEANRFYAERYEEAHKSYREDQDHLLNQAREFQPKRPGDRSRFDKAPVSLFVLGPSRAGKTTMESLIGALQGVKRGYENAIVERSVRRTSQLSGLLTLSALTQLPNHLDSRFGDIYLDEVTQRAGDVRVFTNTHPGRISDVGRLATTIPKTRFIFVRRDEDDAALRIFMKHYKRNTNYYGYTVRNVYRQISWYYRMVDTWLDKLPDITMALSYDDLQTDPAAAAAQAAEFCSLDAAADELPAIGDDRGCAAPYLDRLHAERGAPEPG